MNNNLQMLFLYIFLAISFIIFTWTNDKDNAVKQKSRVVNQR